MSLMMSQIFKSANLTKTYKSKSPEGETLFFFSNEKIDYLLRGIIWQKQFYGGGNFYLHSPFTHITKAVFRKINLPHQTDFYLMESSHS